MKKQTMILTGLWFLPLAGWANPQLASDHPGVAVISAEKDDPEVIREEYRDLDLDGQPTRYDQCHNSLVTRKVNAYGCEKDSDGDGIYDFNDQCPGTAPDREVNFLGCEADSDLDGVVDSLDQCPGTQPGKPVDARGCVVASRPAPSPATSEPGVQDFVISHIVFDTGSFAIRTDQRPILEADAAKLRRLNNNERLLITGFTDNVGSSESNEKLSWNRAQSTKDYLTQTFNIPAEQVYVLGRGEADTIATNDTPEGRQENRRIEFQILSTEAPLPSEARRVIPDAMKNYERFPNRASYN